MTPIFTSKSYPYKHWLTSLALAPIFPILYEIIFDNGRKTLNYLEGYPVFFLMGCLFSLPTFIIYLFAFSYFDKLTKPEYVIKAFLSLGAVLCIFLTFQIIAGSTEKELTFIYSGSVILTTFIYKINPKDPKQADCK